MNDLEHNDAEQVPAADATDEAPETPGEDPRLENDRPSKRGLPPDFGPEERVLMIRPAFFRASPFKTVGLLMLGPVAGVLAYFIAPASQWSWALKVGLWVGAPAMLALVIWWLFVTKGRAIEITNKRTTERRGLLSRASVEVLHDHVRNINVDQSFYERVVGIGTVGIASSGQAGIEIQMRDLPGPDRIREIIDLYRPLD